MTALSAFFALFSVIPFIFGHVGVAQQQARAAAALARFALPSNAEILVQNRRGDIRVELWNEDSVGLEVDEPVASSVLAKTRQPAKSSVQVENSDRGLSITVPTAPVTFARVDLRLFVPARARLTVSTSDGSIQIGGLVSRLKAQTISGDLAIKFPPSFEASIIAQSLNGSVSVGAGIGDGPRVLREKYGAVIGSDERTINLFSGRGKISLAIIDEPREAARIEGRAKQPTSMKQVAETRRPAVAPTPLEEPQEVGEDEVVRVDAELVTLNVSVADRASGRGVTRLTQSDFVLYEDSTQQEIAHFEASSAPFDLLLLIDLSGSTAKVTDIIRAAAHRFVAATRPQDRVAIVAFTSEIAVVSPLTDNRASLREAIDRMAPPKGDTRLYDSLTSSVNYFEREASRSRRRAIVLMSDGLDSVLPNVDGEGSTMSYADVRDRVREFDGLLYTIWAITEYEALSPLDIQPETVDLAGDQMEELAESGGGAFYSVERLEDLAKAYERVVADLGTVYSLSYRPSNQRRDGQWRTIRVRFPRHSNVVARGKRGYFAK